MRGTWSSGFDELLRFVEGALWHSARYLIAWFEGLPVVCAAVFVAGSYAAVEHIVTRKHWRGSGIRSLVTRYCIDLSRRTGARSAIPTASADGAGIYGLLGFTAVGAVRRYHPS